MLNDDISKIDLQLEILQNYYDSMKILKRHRNLQNKVTRCNKLYNPFSRIRNMFPRIKKNVPSSWKSIPHLKQSVRIAILEDCMYRRNGTNNLFRRNEILVLDNGFSSRENIHYNVISQFTFSCPFRTFVETVSTTLCANQLRFILGNYGFWASLHPATSAVTQSLVLCSIIWYTTTTSSPLFLS